MSLVENIKKIKDRVEKLSLNIYGKSKEIKIVAVSKYASTEEILCASRNGVSTFGESRVQDLIKKQIEIEDKLEWHLIGSLQTNKVKDIIDKVELIHSLDRLSLAKEINKRAKSKNIIVPCLIQVNISEESSKSGIPKEELMDFIYELEGYNHIKVSGLMAIGPNTKDVKEIRNCFREMKMQYDYIISKEIEHIEMKILSMGMSNDYDIAIEEGANMIRVGSAIFK